MSVGHQAALGNMLMTVAALTVITTGVLLIYRKIGPWR